jgi:hypothetical protein
MVALSSDQKFSHLRDLLQGLNRDAYGNLRGERVRQLSRIALSMTDSLSDHDFNILEAEIISIRKTQEKRLQTWSRMQGNH